MKLNHCQNCDTENPIDNKYCSNCGYELPKVETEKLKEKELIQKDNSKEKKKKFVGIIVGIIVFGLAYFGTQQLFFKTPSFDNTLMNIASEINKTCPIMVDSETRLDNTVSLPDKILQYNYTIINVVKDSVNLSNVRSLLEPNIIKSVRNNPQMKTLKDYKTTFNYNYKDKNGQFLLLISITPDRYE
jgi:hydrogenase maturation factor HypF (carbamoyltransferase family)